MTRDFQRFFTHIMPQAPSLSFASLIDEYINFYARGDSHTARAKRSDLQRFTEFLCHHLGIEDRKKITIKDWDHSATQAFVSACLKMGESPATVARRLATLKHLGRTFSEKRDDFVNPTREVKPPKLELQRPKALSAEEVKVLLTKVERDHGLQKFKHVRDRIIVAILLETGLRADEVRTLRFKQLDPSLEWLHKVRTKGNKFRKVYISSQIREKLVGYLKARDDELERAWPTRAKSADSELPVFLSSFRSKPGDVNSFFMSPKTLWRIVKNFSGETKLHPHLLRHTFATDLLDSSKDIRLVAQALGHSDVRITMRYTERTDEEIATAIEKSSGKARKK